MLDWLTGTPVAVSDATWTLLLALHPPQPGLLDESSASAAERSIS